MRQLDTATYGLYDSRQTAASAMDAGRMGRLAPRRPRRLPVEHTQTRGLCHDDWRRARVPAQQPGALHRRRARVARPRASPAQPRVRAAPTGQLESKTCRATGLDVRPDDFRRDPDLRNRTGRRYCRFRGRWIQAAERYGPVRRSRYGPTPTRKGLAMRGGPVAFRGVNQSGATNPAKGLYCQLTYYILNSVSLSYSFSQPVQSRERRTGGRFA
jgi:hypothetical protein